jgi:hypothetical protein
LPYSNALEARTKWKSRWQKAGDPERKTLSPLRQREQEVRDRINSASIVPDHKMSGTTKP